MKIVYKLLLFVLVGVILLSFNKAIASSTLSVISNEGESTIYGSVLNPQDDEINISLSKKALKSLRQAGLDNISVSCTSAIDSTKTYTVPSDAINIQRKRIGKKNTRYLVISLFNLTTQSGITISPSALPAGNYKLRIVGKELDLSTDSFNYQTPSLIVGTVDSESNGLVSVEDLTGNTISERTVATNPDGTFFTEVRANKRTPNTQLQRHFKAQVSEENTGTDAATEETVEVIDTGVVHAVTDTDLYAIVPLGNDPENNAGITNKPIEVNETTTLTANIAKEDEELAAEVAKDKLEQIQTSSEGPSEDTFSGDDSTCDQDIFQLAHLCKSINNEDDYASIGAEFRALLQTLNCNFSEFKLIKALLLAAPEGINGFVGKGYCEHVGREVDENRPCDIYKGILADFKKGLILQLPCPPPYCIAFQAIRPPKCVEPRRICEVPLPIIDEPPFAFIQRIEPTFSEGCIPRPVKDLYCAKVGIDITEEECRNDEFENTQFGPNWKVVSDVDGNKYCVPGNMPPPPPQPVDFVGPKPPSTPQDIANECKIHECHKGCEKQFGNYYPPQPIIEPPLSQPSFTATTTTASFQVGSNFAACPVCDCHFNCDAEAGRVFDCGNPESKYFSVQCCNQGPVIVGPVFFQTASTTKNISTPRPGFQPVAYDLRTCLCEDKNNFNEKGFVKEDIIKLCKESCPTGYEKLPDREGCFPICPSGYVRDPGGICRKNCPKGFIQDDFGGCSCPEGFILDGNKCIQEQCPVYCKDIRPLIGRFQTTPVPPECSKCFTNQCGSNMIPNPKGDRPNQASCICPNGLPFWDDRTSSCVAVCSDGRKPYENQQGLPQNSPIPCSKNGGPAGQCPSDRPYLDYTGTCLATCPSGTQPGVYSFSGPNIVPSNSQNGPLECLCFNGARPGFDGSCGTQGQYCEAGQIPTREKPCDCASPGYHGANGICQCPGGYSIAYSSLGCGSTLRNCTTGEKPEPLVCQCAPGAFVNSTGECACSNGEYTGGGCNTITTCPPPYVKNPSGNPPCKCPDATPINFSGSCVAQCPSGLIADYQSSYGSSASTMKDCLCPDKSYPRYTGSNSQFSCDSTQRYCGLSEIPSRDNCICAQDASPSGPQGECRCTNGGTYSSTGCTQVDCPSPYVRNPSGTPPCKCPDATPYSLTTSGGSTCVATCPAGSTPGVPSGSTESTAMRMCLCNDGTPVRADGTCTTSAGICAAGQVSTATNPCTCAAPATVNSNGACQCPSGYTIAYSAQGCGSLTTTTCAPGQVPSLAVPCVCAGTASFNSNNICACPTGQTYTASGCTIQQTGDSVTLSSVEINGDQVTVNYTKNFNTCAHLKDTNYNILHTNNVFCGSSGPVTVPLSEFSSSLVPGLQVFLCHGNNCSNVKSATITVTRICTSPKILDTATNTCICPSGQVQDPNNANNCIVQVSCTSPKILDTATNTCICPSGQTEDANGNCIIPISGTINLSSVSIQRNTNFSGDYAVSINFTKSFSDCVRLTTTDGTSLHAAGASVSQLCLSSTNVAITQFTSQFATGLQVKLCTLDGSLCSSIVTVSG